MKVCAAVLGFAVLATANQPGKGPYTPARKFYSVPTLDASVGTGEMHVYYPSNGKPGENFPLISYAHGAAGGGVDLLGYTRLFNDIASFGFIIVAPNTCFSGCSDRQMHYADCNPSAKHTAGGWSTWFGEQLKSIEWAQNQTDAEDKILSMVDWEAGVGISGHSMGGQSTTWAAHDDCAAQWNIKAAVIHHGAGGNIGWKGNGAVNITKTPLAAYTSSGDGCCERPTKEDYDAAPVRPKVYRDIQGSSHLEPVLEPPAENPLLATYTAAFFKIYLNGDSDSYYKMIFDETSDDYICKSQKMKECIVEKAAVLV